MIKLFSLKNIAPLLTIIIAFIVTFTPYRFGIATDQLILSLLGLLAINALIDKSYLFEDIRSKIENISQKRELFGFRKEFGSTEDLIEKAKSEILVSGIGLDTIAKLANIFENQIKLGVKVRFLAVENDQKLTGEIGEYFQESTDGLLNRIKNNLDTIYKKLLEKYPENVEIHVIKHRPALGYFIIDSSSNNGYMRVEPYICDTEMHERPMFHLVKTENTQWFDIYKKDFDNLWKMSRPWSLK